MSTIITKPDNFDKHPRQFSIPMNEIRINEKISYIPAADEPLSADVGIIRDEGKLWLFDVGCGEAHLADTNRRSCFKEANTALILRQN